jgi:hypothetical protein
MKYLTYITLTACLAFVAVASAAPDIANVDPANKATLERSDGMRQAHEAAACRKNRLTLLLDHGPRAETTPWLNQQRRTRFDTQKKACELRAAKAQ